MNLPARRPRRPDRLPLRPASRAERRGTVIVVVIALLGALMLLGFLFVTISLQEERSGEAFSDSRKEPADLAPPFDEALEQLIVGPPVENWNSVLWGGRHSLLANMVGADLVPHDGAGVNTVWAGGLPMVDVNRDGEFKAEDALDNGDLLDPYQWALRMTLAPGSQPEFSEAPSTLPPRAYGDEMGVYLRNLRGPVNFAAALGGATSLPNGVLPPAPDVDFTYPDHTSAFLSYEYVEPVTGRKVVLPSFHRPQLLRNRTGSADTTAAPGADPNGDLSDAAPLPAPQLNAHPWYTQVSTLPFVMRPHAQRRAVAFIPESPLQNWVPLVGGPFASAYAARRYVTAAYPDVSDLANTTVNTDDPTYVPPIDVDVAREPYLRNPGPANPAETNPAVLYAYDMDPDNDGVKDAVALDLGLAPRQAQDGIGLYVPMFGFKIVDVTSLFDLNRHGNSYGEVAQDADNNQVDDSLTLTGGNFVANLGGAAFVGPISQSHLGLTPDEVNPQYGLSGLGTASAGGATPTRGAGDEAFEAFRSFYDGHAWEGNERQARNLEWWFLLHGRGTFRDDPRGGGRIADRLLEGRYGEPQKLLEGMQQLQTADTAAMAFPYPGLTYRPRQPAGAADDNGDRYAGTGFGRLPELIFGSYFRRSDGTEFGRAMFPAAEGVALDRRGGGLSTDFADALDRLFLVGGAAPGPATAALGVRSRFPAAVNALLPVFDAVADAGLPVRQVGTGQIARAWLGGTAVVRQRDAAAAAANFGAGGGLQNGGLAPALGGSTPTSGGAAAVQPASAVSDSLYAGLLEGQKRLEYEDPGEMVTDYRRASRYDAPYGPAETVALHLSDDDRRAAGAESRLLELVPASFVHSPNAAAVRKRYTSVSTTVTTSAGVYEPAPDPTIAGAPDARSPGAIARAWEYTDPDVNRADEGAPRTFPPTFGMTFDRPLDPFRPELRASLRHAVRDRPSAQDDPVTVALDNLNEADPSDGSKRLRRLIRKLSFNGVLERVTNPADPLYDSLVQVDADYDGDISIDTDDDGNPDRVGSGELRIRPLTPHPAGLDAAPVGNPPNHPGYAGGTPSAPRFGISDVTLGELAKANGGQGHTTWSFNTGTPAAMQEWHARRDRQNLARDLFVLLYVLGGLEPDGSGGTDATFNYAENPYGDPAAVRELAQLAVNLVDAVDGDSVRTLFVYDKDLTDGYVLNDDAYSADGRAALFDGTDAERGVVAGVERQDFALSEVLANLAWAKDKMNPNMYEDNPLTEWDEGAGNEALDFLFVELFYTGSGEYDFGRNPAFNNPTPGENWRVVVRDPRDGRQFRSGAAETDPGNLTDRAVIPRGGRVDAQNPYFVIASADEALATKQATLPATMPDGPRSRMRVNFEQRIDDLGGAPNTNVAPWVDLAPRPFASRAAQNDPNAVVKDSAAGNNARILDLFAMRRPGAPTAAESMPFAVQTLNEGELTTLSVAAAGATGDHDLLAMTAAQKKTAETAPPVLEVLLQTRLNPLRAGHLEDPGTLPGDLADRERDNPWVTVDRMRTTMTRLDLYDDDDNDMFTGRPAGTFAAHFRDETAPGPATGNEDLGPKVSSRVRRRPLLRASELAARRKNAAADPDDPTHQGSMLPPALNPDPDARKLAGDGDGTSTVIFNSLGGHDANAPRFVGTRDPRPFDLWQPHFDRPLAGPADLGLIPLYDAEHLTGLNEAGDADAAPDPGTVRQIGLGYDPTPTDTQDTDANAARLNRLNVAASRLLYPDVKRAPWQSDAAGGGGTERFNMWYRLLQHVGTPRTTAEMIAAGAAPGTVRLGPTAGLASDGTFDLGAVRDGGKINLNTLAGPEPLAGLLDELDRVHGNVLRVDPVSTSDFTTLGLPVAGLTVAGVSGVQDINPSPLDNDWYRSLLVSRDGVDPLTVPAQWREPLWPAATRLVLPGVAHRGQSGGPNGSRDGHIFGGFNLPTRSLDTAVALNGEDGVSQHLRDAIQGTVLRARPNDTAGWLTATTASAPKYATGFTAHDAALPRAFFGLGGADLNSDLDQPDLDFTTRYRLLNKVLNNATHRGETFLCWIQIEYHHAREITGFQQDNPATTGVDESRMKLVRIGAKRDDSPGYRAAFLIDRSRVPELLRADHLPSLQSDPVIGPGPDGILGNADDERISTYSFARDPLSGGALFPWRDLVIHRQRIR